jgi:hypothetical protein
VAWLNSLPEVQALLAAEFGGKPVREQNLSDWRKHGYKKWRRWREAQALVAETAALRTDPGSLMGNLATWGAVYYLVTMKEYVDQTEEAQVAGGGQLQAQPAKLKLMGQFCRDAVALQRNQYTGARLQMEQERLAWRDGGTAEARPANNNQPRTSNIH